MFWVFEAIASHQLHPKIWRNPKLKKFQIWDFDIAEDESAVLEVRSHDDEEAVCTQRFEWVSFPFKSIRFLVVEFRCVTEKNCKVFQYCDLP
ncbi:DUF6876 family protein [Waterburya agarophytonicola]|uniref:DUF6876 family protein n=1 Tax=Waterburya agarophytonicola TaxID=2886916 RepID=UPI0034E1EF2F